MGAKEQREARLAAQLRANLKRRKAAPLDRDPAPVEEGGDRKCDR